MKVFAISDLHLSINSPKPMDIFGGAWDNYIDHITSSWNENVSDEDVVLIAGDISWAMTLDQAIPDLEFIGNLKGHKILIRGNHDYWWKSISLVRSKLANNTYAVQNDCIRMGDFLFAGSRGWTTPDKAHAKDDDKKIYDRELLRMELSLQAMQKMRKENDKVVTMVHYPPFNTSFSASPFTELFSKYRVDAVVYGHLHGKDCRTKLQQKIGEVDYFLTSCDLVRNELVRIFD